MQKKTILTKNDDLGKLSKFLKKEKTSFPRKLIGYTRRFMLVKHENRLPPCHVRPNPAKLRGNRFVQSMPCPRTPPDLPNPIFINFRSLFGQFFGFFGFLVFGIQFFGHLCPLFGFFSACFLVYRV